MEVTFRNAISAIFRRKKSTIFSAGLLTFVSISWTLSGSTFYLETPYSTSDNGIIRTDSHLYLSALATGSDVAPVSAVSLPRCLRAHRSVPLRVLLVGHSRVWQLFWQLLRQSNGRLRSRELPAHGPAYGGEPRRGQRHWPLGTNSSCVEVFRKPSSWWHQRPSCSWAGDAPGLQLDIRWRDWVNPHLNQLLVDTLDHRPTLLVLALGLKDTVRDRRRFLHQPQRLWRHLHQLNRDAVAPLSSATTTLLLLDYPANPAQLRTEHERGVGAVLAVVNAAMFDIFGATDGLRIWTSPIARAIRHYTVTCSGQQQQQQSAPPHCGQDTFHPGPDVVQSLVEDLLPLVC